VPQVLGEVPEATVSPEDLAERMAGGTGPVTVIDLDLSTRYERAHIPGARWCVRARLGDALAEASEETLVVLTSGDGLLARVALPDARTLSPCNVEALSGGTEAWLAGGRPAAGGLEHIIGPTDDVWYKPYDHRGNQEQFMRDYLTWEVALVEQIERDGTTRFQAL
jgi:3-mercaptopyruvate sulfurtransferase SseA